MAGESAVFICPECDGREADVTVFVDQGFVEDDPWSGVLRIVRCKGCGFPVPAHIAFRWNDLPLEDGKREWREDYRAQAKEHWPG